MSRFVFYKKVYRNETALFHCETKLFYCLTTIWFLIGVSSILLKIYKQMPRFIFNDERTVNSYGFRIKTSGISLERFKKNPVMLDGHNSSNLSVIGTWKDIKTDEYTLSASPEFDTEDEHAKQISGKVERNIIRACSMGVSFDKKNLKIENGVLVLAECELIECSIVAVPSNANALRLYVGGDLLDEKAARELCLSVKDNSVALKKQEFMNKVKLSQLAIIALGFAQNTTELSLEEVDKAVLELQAKNKDLESKLLVSEEKVNAFLEKEKTAKQAEIQKMVDLAVQQGQITADKKQTFIDLANRDFELAKTTLAAIPAKKEFGAGLQTPSDVNTITTMEAFQKLSLSEQLAYKENNPEGYKAILKTI